MALERDERPWGYYEVVDEGDDFRVKRISITSGCRLSYQRHTRRSEHWFVVAGSGTAIIDGVEHRVSVGSTIDVPVGVAHRMCSDEGQELTFVEVQTGSYFGEDDIERLSDDYGRCEPAATTAD